MKTYYFVAAVLAFINLAIFFYRDNREKTSYYLKEMLLIQCVANLGYLALGLSGTLEEALLANKITYLGGCFMPPVMAYCMCAICNIKISRLARCASLSFSVAVFVMVLSTGFSDFYYSSVRMGKSHDATALIVEHGVGYFFFYVILYGYIVLDLVIIVIAYIKRQVSRKSLYLLIALQAVTIVAFLVGRAIDPVLEVMPAVYVMDGFILLILQSQLFRYNIDDSISAAIRQNNTMGYIVIDAKDRFIACNDIARECIPGLTECKVDTPISRRKGLAFLCEWVKQFKENGEAASVQTLQCKDSYYECVVKPLATGKNRTSYIVELQDCTDRKRYLDLLSHYNAELEKQVEQKTQHINLIQRKIVLGMASMVENRDDSTGGHIKRTSDVIEILVGTINQNHLLDLSDKFCRDLIKAAPMHDLGKIAIEDRILRKPGKFTDEEFAIMKTHAEKSAEIVERILRGAEEENFVNLAVNVARYHHEKWNGQGYPMGLSGEEIPLEARIMAIADVYDALVSKRCYKEAMSFEKAYDIIMESMGSHFDPGLEQVFVLSRDKLEAYYKNEAVELE